MVDRYDKSFTRKPAEPGPSAARTPPQQDDPLVELARIVSGNQSFDDIVGRPAAQPGAAPRAQVPPARPAGRDISFDLESELLNDLQSSFDTPSRPAPPPQQPPRQAYPEPPPPRVAQVPPRAAQMAAPPPQPEPRESFEHMRLRPGQPQPANWTSPREPQPAPEDDPYSGTAYASTGDYDRQPADPLSASRVFGRGQQPGYDEPQAGQYDDDYYGDEPGEPVYDEADYGEERFTEFDGYEAERPRRSRKILITAAIVLAVVLAGGLAALALMDRSTTGSGSAPRVIAADEAPTKVQPAAQPAAEDGQQNKVIYDRANPDAGVAEQLVLPDDGALDAAPASNESAASREISRIILPGAPGDPASSPAVPDMQSPADPTAADDDAAPRKVRTVVIKPDGTIVSSEAKPRDAASGTTDVAVVPENAPIVAQDAGPTEQPIAVSPPQAAEPAASEPLPAAEAPVASQKDLSQMEEPQPAPAPARQAAAPAPAVVAPSASGTGGFVVQVTSQRSEAQAVSAFASLQRKFPGILGSRSPDIVRADLGAKGIYYRARVGPMATRDEAISLCEALKAAGGDCIVQKN